MKKYPKDTKFFLASCDVAVADEIKKAFPDRILELPEKDYLGDIDAIADLYLLAEGSKFIATFDHSFLRSGMVAWRSRGEGESGWELFSVGEYRTTLAENSNVLKKDKIYHERTNFRSDTGT